MNDGIGRPLIVCLFVFPFPPLFVSFSKTGAVALAHALTKNRTLRTLSLEWNSLGLFPEGFRALSATLALPSSTLTSLDFRNNRLTADAGTSIANALNTNRSVNTLDLRWNSLGKRAKCCVSLLCVLVVCHCCMSL